MNDKEMNKRNALQVMIGLIKIVKPLLGVMMIAIFMGCLGNLAAAFITVLGGLGIGVVIGAIKHYAYTILPIAIAFLTSLIMFLFIGSFHWILGGLAFVFYCMAGILIPVVNSWAGQKYGREYRDLYGKLNTTVLDNIFHT